MNYLAHLQLSGDSDKIKVGNFVADWVKGNAYHNFPVEIQEGILMHRAIDSFTDHHPLYLHSKQYFRPSYRLFSGIVVDVLYDHFLSAHWEEYNKVDRRKFIADAYRTMNLYKIYLPPRPQRLLPAIIHHDWLGAYASFNGLEKVLERMSKRTALPAMTINAIQILRDNYGEMERDFLSFYPELQRHVAVFKESQATR